MQRPAGARGGGPLLTRSSVLPSQPPQLKGTRRKMRRPGRPARWGCSCERASSPCSRLVVCLWSLAEKEKNGAKAEMKVPVISEKSQADALKAQRSQHLPFALQGLKSTEARGRSALPRQCPGVGEPRPGDQSLLAVHRGRRRMRRAGWRTTGGPGLKPTTWRAGG